MGEDGPTHNGELLLLFRFARLTGYLEVVLDAEYARNAVGPKVGGIFVRLGIDNAVELNVPVLHGNADGLGRVDCMMDIHRPIARRQGEFDRP